MAQKFVRNHQLKFREADPAQIMYFANVFSLAHDTFEEFIVAAGIPWNLWFKDYDYHVPIRHTEADFLAPFVPGVVYAIEAQVAHIGNSSFQMQYTFSDKSKRHAVVKMVHTFLDPKSHEKVAVPEKFRDKLAKYLIKEGS